MKGVILVIIIMLSAFVAAFADDKPASAPTLPPPTVDPDDAKERRKALKEFIKKKGLVNLTKGSMLCTNNRIAQGYIVAGERGNDLRQPLDVYQIEDHVAKLLKKGLSAYLTKPEANAGGVDVISDGPGGEMLIYRAYECKLKFGKEKDHKHKK